MYQSDPKKQKVFVHGKKDPIGRRFSVVASDLAQEYPVGATQPHPGWCTQSWRCRALQELFAGPTTRRLKLTKLHLGYVHFPHCTMRRGPSEHFSQVIIPFTC